MDAGSSYSRRRTARTYTLRVMNTTTRKSRGLDAGATRRSGITNGRTRGPRRTDPMTGRGDRRTDALEALVPTSPLSMMVLIIKILVIALAEAMAPPIWILLMKTLPVMRIVFIPGIPLRRIPDGGSDNIGGRIGVIRGPAILIAEKMVQYAV